MDLYSAAKRLARPFVFGSPEEIDKLPIDAHALIGDGVTAALVRVDGAIDWACFPRFDSPSVFASLLGPKGGCTAITPASCPFESLQRYDPDTNVLETLFRVEGQGAVRLIDFMPWSNDPGAAVHEIHRRVQCLEGNVNLRVLFDPRFQYGAGTTEIDVLEHGVLARGPDGERLAGVVSGTTAWSKREGGGVELNLSLKAGERRFMVISWDAPKPEPISAYRTFDYLRSTRLHWREFAGELQYDGPWRHHVLRSALLLKMLVHEPTGAMVAAPTTSLPEWRGGSRNWDYRYTWTRDAAMAMRASNLIGYASDARDFFHYMRNALAQNEQLQVMYAIDGSSVPTERTLDHLAGFDGSGPVRVGNGARDQLQLDTVGALVDAAYLYERFGGALPLRSWRQVRRVLEELTQGWTAPDDGIWEPRGGRRHNVHSKLMCWLAFDRGARIAPRFGDDDAATRWSRSASLVHADILRGGLDESGRYFTAAYGAKHVDGALLVMPLHGFMEPDHPLMVGTVRRVQQELATGPFIHRYKIDDGVGGKEGAFVLCGFWLAEALAMMGEVDEAQEVFRAHADASNHVGLLAEEIDPRNREQLGNFPQAFSHLGLINAAVRIDLAIRMRDEGLHGVPHVTERIATKRG